MLGAPGLDVEAVHGGAEHLGVGEGFVVVAGTFVRKVFVDLRLQGRAHLVEFADDRHLTEEHHRGIFGAEVDDAFGGQEAAHLEDGEAGTVFLLEVRPRPSMPGGVEVDRVPRLGENEEVGMGEGLPLLHRGQNPGRRPVQEGADPRLVVDRPVAAAGTGF